MARGCWDDIEVFGKNDATTWQSNIITGLGTRIMSEQVHSHPFSLADDYLTYVLQFGLLAGMGTVFTPLDFSSSAQALVSRSGKVQLAGGFHEDVRPERERGSAEGAVNSGSRSWIR